MRIGAITDPQLRRELQGTDDWLRQLSTNQARLVQMPPGTPTAVTNPSPTGIDTGAFLYLPGRSHEQMSLGPVSFDAFGLAYSDSAPTTERTLSLRATTSDGSAQPARVFLGIQGSRVGTTASAQKRYWAFPSFTEINTGPSTGLHYFVDQDDYQSLSKKTLNNDCYLKLEDTVGGSGIINAGRTSVLQFAWGSGYPAGGGSAVTPTTLTGVVPSLQIPGLDYKDSGVGVRDRTHVWCILKSDHTDTTPFEPGTPVFGSSSGKELYAMFGTAQGTLAAPATNSFPIWHAVVTQSCTFTLSSPTATMASTTGIVKGMRMRETLNAYSLPENMHVLSVDSPTQITMGANWPASNLTRTIDFFGMTWSDTATSVTLSHSALTGLSADDHTQYLLLNTAALNRATGQRIGTATQTGNSDDVAISGRLSIGTGAYQLGQKLVVSDVLSAITGVVNLARLTPSVTAVGGSTATYRALLCQITGGSSITSNSPSFVGAFFTVSPAITSGSSVSVGDCLGLDMSATIQITATGSTANLIAGFRGGARGGASNMGDTFVNTQISGALSVVSSGTGKTQAMNGLNLTMDTANKSYSLTTRTAGINLDLFGNTGNTSWGKTNWPCVVTGGSANLTSFTNAGQIQVGQYVSGTNIPSGSYVIATDNVMLIVTLNNNATGAGTSVDVWGTTVYWSGIYRSFALPLGGEVTNGRFVDLQADIPSQHYGAFYFRPPTASSYPAPTAWVHIGAGAAAAGSAPLKLTSGTSLTTAEAGAMEFTTDDFFLTITTGAARKGIVLDNGSRLTSGRVPFATTNGRLIDDSDMTFSVDTLTVTKLVVGAGTAVTNLPKTLFDDFADIGNIGTGEDDLFSHTIAASQLATNGDKLTSNMAGIFVSSATATRRLKAYFGGTLIYDSSALSLSTSSDWDMKMIVLRESSTVVRCSVTVNTTTASSAPYCQYTRITGLTLSNTNVLKITGEAAGVGAATDDIVAKLGTIVFVPAA